MRKKSEVIITSENEIGCRSDLYISRYLWLAQAMAMPLRANLDYNSIARKALVVQQLPQGAIPVYKKRLGVFKHNHVIINSKNDIGTREQLIRLPNGSRVTIPTFQIYSNPTVRIADVKSRRFNIIDRSLQKARQEIMAQEDASIFEALDDLCKEKPKRKKSSIFDKMKSWYKKLLQYLDI